MLLSFLFFFSSRRRHTRWPRDWSSDVCSSDLRNNGCIYHKKLSYCCRKSTPWSFSFYPTGRSCTSRHRSDHEGRSEERRVGKESRWRRSRPHRKTREQRAGRTTPQRREQKTTD